jgi:O-acetyl-ADP-ribose deacetylase (regulator of RNase III)
MTKQIVIGNLLNHPNGLIVHGCNCQGVMGGGVALAVRNTYPAAYQTYYNEYVQNGLQLGQIISVEVEENKWVINAMTQDQYGSDRRYVNYDAIAVAFEQIRDYARQVANVRGFAPDIAYPLIGAGLAKGNWHIVEKIIDETLCGEFNQVLYGFETELKAWGLIS